MSIAKTGLLLAALTALFMVVGYLIGGQQGMIIAFVVAAAMNFFSYWNADKIVLRMYKAQPVDARSQPQFYGLVEQMAHRADLPMPKVYVIDDPQPNAFATGRNPDNAAVAATTGLLNTLSYEEVAGVMAHELAHVRNRDTLVMTVTATIAGAIGMLAQFLQFQMLFGGGDRNNPLGIIGVIAAIILAPLAAMLVQMAISRTREYGADAMGAQICGQPLWLASALQKLERGAARIDNDAAERNPATAHMFIVNPLHARSLDKLFSTHPSTADRVRRLQAMAGPGASGIAPASSRESGPWDSAADQQRGPWG